MSQVMVHTVESSVEEVELKEVPFWPKVLLAAMYGFGAAMVFLEVLIFKGGRMALKMLENTWAPQTISALNVVELAFWGLFLVLIALLLVAVPILYFSAYSYVKKSHDFYYPKPPKIKKPTYAHRHTVVSTPVPVKAAPAKPAPVKDEVPAAQVPAPAPAPAKVAEAAASEKRHCFFFRVQDKLYVLLQNGELPVFDPKKPLGVHEAVDPKLIKQVKLPDDSGFVATWLNIDDELSRKVLIRDNKSVDSRFLPKEGFLKDVEKATFDDFQAAATNKPDLAKAFGYIMAALPS